MRKLGRYFSALVVVLLLASAATFAAGVVGLQRLNASFDSVVKEDVNRLLSITDIRRRLRSRLLLERDLLAAKDPEKAAVMAKDLAKAAGGIAKEASNYERFLVDEDRAAWAALREDIAHQDTISAKVLAVWETGNLTEAGALAATHSNAWEGLIKSLITVAQERLDRKSKEAGDLYYTSRTVVWSAFLLSGVVGVVAGFFLYRGIRRMVAEVIELKDKLLAVNAGLESTVEERTRTIRAILDNVQFGFFLAGRDLRITEGYTRSLRLLLGQQELGGLRISEALGLEGARADEFDLMLGQCFDDVFPDEVACGQVPSRIERAGRILSVQVSIVRNREGHIHQLLFGLSDVTELEAAERNTREAHALLRAIKNPEPFRLFVADLNQRFHAIREAVEASDETHARRELHTIKGNAGCYGLTDIAAKAHQIEEEPAIELPKVIDLEHAFGQFLSSHEDVLGITKEGREQLRISSAQLADLEALLERTTDNELLRRALSSRLERLRWRRADELIGPIDSLVRTLGERLGKDVLFSVKGGDVSLLPENVAPVMAVLPHLVRNAMDHGFEERGARGAKPSTGTLELSFEDHDESWRITISDDGRGINTEAVRQKAIERGILRATDTLDHDQVCSLIFLPSFSTAQEASDISGRGEGMGAVSDAIKRVGGQLRVRSVFGEGTRITLEIPKRNAGQQARAA